MRKLALLSLLLATASCAFEAPAAAPPPPRLTAAPSGAPPLAAALAPFSFLLGRWEAPASGGPGASSGGFSFEPDAQGHVILRRNTSQTPKGRHDDVMMMYELPQGEVHALYADNEGHVIDYTVTATDTPKRAVFMSREAPGAPRFHLSYRLNDDNSLAGTFEIGPPGATEFKPYLEWTARRP